MSVMWTKTITWGENAFELPPMPPPVIKFLEKYPKFIAFENHIIELFKQYDLERITPSTQVDEKFRNLLESQFIVFVNIFEEMNNSLASGEDPIILPN